MRCIWCFSSAFVSLHFVSFLFYRLIPYRLKEKASGVVQRSVRQDGGQFFFFFLFFCLFPCAEWIWKIVNVDSTNYFSKKLMVSYLLLSCPWHSELLVGWKISSLFSTWDHTKGTSYCEFFCWVNSSEMQGVRNFFMLMSRFSVYISHILKISFKDSLVFTADLKYLVSVLAPPTADVWSCVSSSLLTPFLLLLNVETEKGSVTRQKLCSSCLLWQGSQPRVLLPQTSEGQIPSLWSDNLWLPFTRPRGGTYAVVFPNIITKFILWDQFILNCSWIILWNCFAFKAFILQSG